MMSAGRRLAVFVAALLALAGPAGAAPPSREPQLSVVAFNVLAPVWAAPDWYPDQMDMSLLDTEFRRERIARFLAGRASTTDVFCLQEVQDSELPHLLAALGPSFQGFMARNDPDWWSNWLVPEIPWAPNGTAVIVNRKSLSVAFFRDLAISGDGNHAALFDGVHRATGRHVRVASIHLDSDFESNRLREARSLMQQLPMDTRSTDIVCGDVNEDAVTGAVSNVFEPAGFVDVLAEVGNREPTHPWSSSYNTAPRWAIIDHIIVRNGRPLSGDVFDFGVWSIADEVARIEANFRNTGSDHFPIGGASGL
jgi:endonuclease/exonuclease/phosphatase family metal-dependent hydrolase